MKMSEYTFRVPSGIGDISWVYSKLVNLPYDFNLEIADEGPNRSLPYTQLLPKVKKSSYAKFRYGQSFVVDKLGLTKDADILNLKPGTYYVSANQHLENGNRIETFLPQLPTTYHYEFKELDHHPIYRKRKPLIGIYPSKYQTIGWKFWEVDKWKKLMRLVQNELGDIEFVILGAEFDKNLGDDIAKGFDNATSLVGKTHIGEAINIIKQMDYFFAYPSGLGILADVVNTSCMMFIPPDDWAKGLVDSYADPQNIQSGRHINRVFCAPETAFELFVSKGPLVKA